MNKLIISLTAVLVIGCATTERNTDYIKPTDEYKEKSEYVPAPPRMTPDAGPTISAIEGKEKEYLPVRTKGVGELQHSIYNDKIG